MSELDILSPIHNDIIFEFVDKVDRHGNFKKTTDSGIQLIESDITYAQQSNELAREVKVLAVGPNCDPEIQVGMTVIVERLRWTLQFVFNGKQRWKTDDRSILAIMD